MYYIGVDLGTSAVKLILMDSSGKNILYRFHNLVGLNKIHRIGMKRALRVLSS